MTNREDALIIRLGYGEAVDLAFLTEMSNLSPPIIHPPPSSLEAPRWPPGQRGVLVSEAARGVATPPTRPAAATD